MTTNMQTRLDRLRAAMVAADLDGWVIGREDMFQGEEVPPGEERLQYISGFTGSAGMAVVLADHAGLFSDGRYSLQMGVQADPAAWRCHTWPEETVKDWLTPLVAEMGGTTAPRIGVDTRLITQGGFDTLAASMAEAGAELVPHTRNLIDEIWHGRPAMPVAAPFAMADDVAGQSVAEKLAALDMALDEADCQAALITRVDAVNWLVNIRGRDLPCTPVNLAFALYHRDNGLILLAEPGRMAPVMSPEFSVVPLEQFADLLDPKAGYDAEMRLMIEPASLPRALYDLVAASPVEAVAKSCPVTALKAIKNAVELQGIRDAHVEDGVAMVRFLRWLEGITPDQWQESAIADELLRFRQQSPLFLCPSFDTISGAGPNGAIVHYRAIAGQDSALINDNLLLVDSGGHYQSGTTDITRTIAIGTPSDAMRACFTAVLKGHIALAMARFPKGTTGVQLDAVTRGPLWAAGLDYAHGTGHGVGHVLQVHEGPANISKRGAVPLRPGMFLSNEPGYYRTGEWGIRIENLVIVTAEDADGFSGMETVTLCPIDRRLIDPAALTPAECDWVNAYHARLCAALAPRLDADEQAWLTAACAPL